MRVLVINLIRNNPRVKIHDEQVKTLMLGNSQMLKAKVLRCMLLTKKKKKKKRTLLSKMWYIFTEHQTICFCENSGSLNVMTSSAPSWRRSRDCKLYHNTAATLALSTGSCLPGWIPNSQSRSKLGHISCSVFLTFVLNYHQGGTN